jgi:site-specific recombinase XerD
MLEVLFSAGIRLSELLNLKRDQIKESGEIFIKGQNKKGRVVYLTPRAKKALKKYLSCRADDLPYIFIPYSGSNFEKKDKRITPSYIQRKIKQYRERLGLEIPISAQWLTTDGFANYLIEQSLDPKPINPISFHESIKLTDTYTPAKSTKNTTH